MRWIALLLALFVGSAGAQVSSSRPLLGDKWTTAPAACAVGQIGFDTDATAGANIYGCTAANTWTAQGGTGTVSTVSFTGGLISIANPTTTPAFTVAGTSGGIPYFSGTTTWASSAALTQYGLMIGGGAGATPYTSSGITFGGAAAGTGLFVGAGTATTDVAAFSLTRTNNNAAVVKGIDIVYTDTLSAAGFLPLSIKGGSAGTTNLFKVNKSGEVSTAAGSASSPAYNFGVAGATTGMYTGDGLVRFAVGGALAFSLGTTYFQIGASNDTTISKISAGLFGFGATPGSFAGRIKLTSAIAAGVAIASLNAAPTTGEVQSVTDALTPVIGSTVVAGGAAKALVWYNGANWTVIGI